MKFKIDKPNVNGDITAINLVLWLEDNYTDSKTVTHESYSYPIYLAADRTWQITRFWYPNVFTGKQHVVYEVEIRNEELAVHFALVKDLF